MAARASKHVREKMLRERGSKATSSVRGTHFSGCIEHRCARLECDLLFHRLIKLHCVVKQESRSHRRLHDEAHTRDTTDRMHDRQLLKKASSNTLAQLGHGPEMSQLGDARGKAMATLQTELGA